MPYDFRVEDDDPAVQAMANDGLPIVCFNAFQYAEDNVDTEFNIGHSTYLIHIHFQGNLPRVQKEGSSWGTKVRLIKVKTPRDRELVRFLDRGDKPGNFNRLRKECDAYPVWDKALINLQNAWETFKARKPCWDSKGKNFEFGR